MARESRLSTQIRQAPTRYEATDRIAAGGMAEVWRADAIFESGERHPVAIKRVLPELAADPLYRSMFEDEARLGMMLRHPNIVRVYDARRVRGTFILVMELVDGAPLRDLLELAQQRHLGMPVAASLYIARELARALDYVHGLTDVMGEPLQIIHRDVSPHNVLLGRTGTVKLVDFGLANASIHQTQVGAHMAGGKLGYLAPEIIMQQPATPRIDVFAAGVVLWECLTGRRLFHASTDAETVKNVGLCRVPPPSTVYKGIPEGVDNLVLRALARDPRARVPTARALEEELTQALARVDPDVGAKDVALLVGLFRAGASRKRKVTVAPDVAALLAEELMMFAQASAGAEYDLGQEPLDPAAFGGRG